MHPFIPLKIIYCYVKKLYIWAVKLTIMYFSSNYTTSMFKLSQAV